MAKTDRGRGRQAGQVRPKKPGVVERQASQTGPSVKVEEPVPAIEKTVQVSETTSRQPFDLAAYAKSIAWAYPLALLGIMALMLYLRVVPSYGQVFTGWEGNYVNFASDDAVYHMRLVHETVTHFPERIFYDPFTHYPFGSMIHFGPLLTLIIAGASLIVGLGNPSIALVDAIGAYTPAIMGMLCAVPVYFIGKKLFSRNVGIIAAFTLALLPGQFLGRSMLGFTDHHIAEVLFSVATVAFLIYALEYARTSGLNLEKLKNRDKGALTSLGFGVLAGFSFGLYMLTWPGGLIIGMIIFLYFVIQAVVDYVKNRETEYLLILSSATFLIPAVMVLPYSLTDLSFQLLYYSLTQPFFLGLALAGVGAVYGLAAVHKKTKAEPWTFPVTLLGPGVIGMLFLYLFAQQIFGLVMAGIHVFTPSGGMLVVREATPSYINPATGQIDFSMLWGMFFWTFPIAIVAIAMIAFRTFKDNRPAEWLFLVWNLIMLAATFSQNRFAYYFAVNAALLTGYFVYAVFRAFDWDRFTQNWRKKVKTGDDIGRFVSGHAGQVLGFAALAGIALIVITWPATSLSTGAYSSVDIAKDPGAYFFTGVTELMSRDGPGGINHEWYQTLLWMKNNTPDPQGSDASSTLRYSSGSYNRPKDSDTYAYPASAYGVMSWWDYGHIITYVAHRIPNANPFQAGILEYNNTCGSAPFFLATDGGKAYANLRSLGSRYVVVENRDANGYVAAMSVWADDKDGWMTEKEFPLYKNQPSVALPVNSQKYEQCMLNRLYYQDANDMDHFRLVYESPGDYIVNVNLLDTRDGSIYFDRSFNVANYTEAYGYYVDAIEPVLASQDGSMIAYGARPPAKWVKVFEVVKGASITGTADPGTTVTVSLDLTTGDRTFKYLQSAVADSSGSFTLTVPYATEAMNGTGYSSAVTPAGKYTLTIGNSTSQVDVPERAVQNGETINV
ncbi:oligosaccharyl transferase, archaeosortase A system-associated [Methanocella arvoryzae]|uniref:dolichyl-phosphooligosaccharide-protein glycotransferase n=1 Tax=Methanocella arvoryzae (strain DSM 22066 / NBRC 105507 / MRE50) TaxID=351160 RepID=Q0W817_METAR|nr:oligosaccharyl transferase, archaeosortase A system-associated [Methanocella arvoryzae]CAJ35476.1 transmembrane oligosaccharyltransferase [Methanocella arvoryzae MRE50]